MKYFKIALYTINELTPEARQRAISEHRDFLISMERPDYIDGIEDWNNPEKMEMYEEQIYYLENEDEPILESMEINDYLFFYDGQLANTTTYVSGEKAGTTDIFIYGKRLPVEEVKIND